MVKAQAAPAHRLILFLQQSSVEWASSLWLNVVQEVDPNFQRTVRDRLPGAWGSGAWRLWCMGALPDVPRDLTFNLSVTPCRYSTFRTSFYAHVSACCPL